MPAWLFPTLAWTLAAIAAALLGWALFWDRARGRRRCPKCWYDMSGAGADDGGAFTCPECGCVARTERRLRRTRRRKRAALLAVPLLLAAYGAGVMPGVVDRGWPAAVPTTALVAISPWIVPDMYFVRSYRGRFKPESWQDRLFLDLYEERIKNDELSWWHHRLIARIALRLDPRRLSGDSYGILIDAARKQGHLPDRLVQRLRRHVYLRIRTRDRWPAGSMIYVHGFVDHWDRRGGIVAGADPRQRGMDDLHLSRERVLSYRAHRLAAIDWDDHLIPWTVAPSRLDDRLVDVEVHEVVDGHLIPLTTLTHRFEFEIVASIDEVLTAVDSEPLAAALAQGDTPVLFERGTVAGMQWQPDATAIAEAGSPTVAMTIEVRRHGVLRYTGRAWWSAGEFGRISSPAGDVVTLEPVMPDSSFESSADSVVDTLSWLISNSDSTTTRSTDATPPSPAEWTVTLVPDPELALRDFDSTTYLKNRVTMRAEWGKPLSRGQWLRRRFEGTP